MTHHPPLFDTAAFVTHGGTFAALASWSLNLGTIAVVVSALASVAAVCLQFWLAFGRLKELEESQRKQEIANKINAARVGAVEDRQTFQEIKTPPVVIVAPVVPKDKPK